MVLIIYVSNRIGAVPFLINDGVNGLLFKSENLDSLEEKVCFLLNHPQERIEMATNAIMTMRNEWSPQKAAQRFMYLAEQLLHGSESEFKEGPCSKAYPYKSKL